MLSRSSAVIVSVTSLVTGIVLGVFLARGGPVVSAQVAGRAHARRRPQRRAGVNHTRGRRRKTVRGRKTVGGGVNGMPTTRFTTRWPGSTSNFSRSIARSSWWPRRSRRRSCTSSPRRSRPDRTRRVSRSRRFEETGSGVIIRSNRDPGLYVLTNHHVVDGAKAIQDPGLSARRPLDPSGQGLERREGRHRRAQARPRRSAGGAAGQQRRSPRSGPG